MSDLIFVYGSLMRDVPSAASAWLKVHAQLLAVDTIRGFLYDLGQYPGLVVDDASPHFVKGEVHQLYQQETGLSYLDAYEGIGLAYPEYERIRAGTSAGHLCWVYQCMPVGRAFPLITSGDYCTYYPTNPHHLSFIRRSDASVQNED
ncbi:MAG: gamma-glutamylcyclotransferase family protein [Bacteroidota bacterium]